MPDEVRPENPAFLCCVLFAISYVSYLLGLYRGRDEGRKGPP